MDYTILYRRQVSTDDLRQASRGWRLFISAFNDSERVRNVFSAVETPDKHWVVHPEYQFAPEELPDGDVFTPQSLDEAEFWTSYLGAAMPDLADGEICIDLTGFMRPHLMLFVRLLFDAGATRFTALYTDPERYVKDENTEFTKGPVVGVRQIAGFEGSHLPHVGNDLLVIGTRFDHELIRRVAEDKVDAKKVQLLCLPSLQAEMYQQGVIRTARASEAIGDDVGREPLFAPANDPFVTAQVVSEHVVAERALGGASNLYLSALGTKPQALGFALYYLTELRDTAASIVFPFAERYARETTKGLARTWLYEVELLAPSAAP